MIEFAKKDSRRAIAEKRQEFEARLAKIKEEEERLKANAGQERPRKKQVGYRGNNFYLGGPFLKPCGTACRGA